MTIHIPAIAIECGKYGAVFVLGTLFGLFIMDRMVLTSLNPWNR